MIQYDQSVLTGTEKRIFSLRTLFSKFGYEPYRMRKFEDYDLYSRNKDFLLSDRVITFTDTNGRLKALKPDVTLSLVRNIKDSPDELQRLYYDENVYRVSERSNTFREIMQMGLECIGSAGNASVTEVIGLAESSLALVSEGCEYVLKVSDLDILVPIVEDMTDSKYVREEIYKLISSKNAHEIEALCSRSEIPAAKCRVLTDLIGLYGPPEEVLPEVAAICKGTPAEDEIPELISVLEDFRETDRRIVLDFSIIGDTSYYNGIAFEGYIMGIPECVLVGGRYDMLMRRMKKRSRAIGFAVYLDTLARLSPPAADYASENMSAGSDPASLKEGTTAGEAADPAECAGVTGAAEESARPGIVCSAGAVQMINVALPKGRLGGKAYGMFEEAGYGCPYMFEGRKLIFENREAGVRYFWVKPSDVPIYVERGAADIGIAGKDILLEYGPDVFELMDLGIGKCRMAVAGPAGFRDDSGYPLKVATKFVNIAQNYYASIGRDIDIIKLNGSIEIAPLLGLSDVIVDLVETGTTLRENNLSVLEEVLPVSARLIANKSSYNFKTDPILKLIGRMRELLQD